MSGSERGHVESVIAALKSLRSYDSSLHLAVSRATFDSYPGEGDEVPCYEPGEKPFWVKVVWERDSDAETGRSLVELWTMEP